MKSWRQMIQPLNQRYAALTRRERLLVAAALALGPLLIGNALLLDPQGARKRMLTESINRQNAAVDQLQAQVLSLQQQLKLDPDAAKKAELAALQVEQDKLDEQVRAFGAKLVRPDQMNGLLESLLARHAGLRLLSLKTLAPVSVLGEKSSDKAGEKTSTNGKPSDSAQDRVFDLYRHGVEIRLEGDFGELQAYLEQLEQLQQRLLWGQLSYRVIDYPRAEMRLTVYTLSADKAWLAL